MTTPSKQQTATISRPAAVQRVDRGRVLRLTFGSLALLVALGLFAAASAGIFWLETQRDATGYFVTHPHKYQSSSYALSTESLNISGVAGTLEAGLIRIRITATSTDAAKPLFIGIARTSDANRYLAGIAHDELHDINFDPFKIDYQRLGTGAPKALPSSQTFWQAQTSGTGTQTISWPVTRGQWSAVVMNADGSRHVSVDAQLAARLSGAWWFVAAFIVVGALFLAGGVILVRSGLRKPAAQSASATEAV